MAKYYNIFKSFSWIETCISDENKLGDVEFTINTDFVSQYTNLDDAIRAAYSLYLNNSDDDEDNKQDHYIVLPAATKEIIHSGYLVGPIWSSNKPDDLVHASNI